MSSDSSSSTSSQPKTHVLTGPITITTSRIDGATNSIQGDVNIGSTGSSIKLLAKNVVFDQSSKIDFSQATIENFVSNTNGDIFFVKDNKITSLGTQGNSGKFLRVSPDGFPIYSTIDDVLETRDRSVVSLFKNSPQQVFPSTRSAIMGWSADNDSYFTDDQFDLATGRFITQVNRRFRIDAIVTFQNQGNVGFRTISLRRNDTKSLAEVTLAAHADVAIPQTLVLSSTFTSHPGDFFEIVISHSDPEPITIIPGASTTLSIQIV